MSSHLQLPLCDVQSDDYIFGNLPTSFQFVDSGSRRGRYRCKHFGVDRMDLIIAFRNGTKWTAPENIAGKGLVKQVRVTGVDGCLPLLNELSYGSKLVAVSKVGREVSGICMFSAIRLACEKTRPAIQCS